MTIVTTQFDAAVFVSFSHHILRKCSAPFLSPSCYSIYYRRPVIGSNRFMATNNVASHNSMEMKTPSGLALVDVDCNLLHKDLVTAMDLVSTLEFVDNEVQDEFKILHHPSTVMSNVIAMISPSSTIEESVRSLQLLESSTNKQRNHVCVKTTVGVHPYNTMNRTTDMVFHLKALLDNPNSTPYISCIGETGLDYSEGFPDKSYQIPWFTAQLDLAFQYNLPVFLHERLAFADTLRCIDEVAQAHAGKTIPKIIVHCFTGSYEECVEYMERGYYTSISGYINKPGEGCNELRKCLRDGIVPLEKLMLETDSPYMGFPGNKDSFFHAEGENFLRLPSKKRKRLMSMYPNVPSSLPLVLHAVHDEINFGREQRGEHRLSIEELAQITTNNAIDFFALNVL